VEEKKWQKRISTRPQNDGKEEKSGEVSESACVRAIRWDDGTGRVNGWMDGQMGLGGARHRTEVRAG
jgi:hypothetical protein